MAMPSRTLFTVLEETAAQYGSLPALYQPERGKGSPRYRSYTWNDFRDAAREIACRLRMLGVQKGDIVALHSETRAEFYLSDLGIMANGSISAALYTSLPPGDHVRTIVVTEPKAIFVEDTKALRALRQAGVDLPGMQWILLTGAASD